MGAVYWQHRRLTPAVLGHVPPGYRAVLTKDDATARWCDVADRVALPPQRREHFETLWTAVLDGLQPSGLLVACLTSLAPLLGHTSNILPKRFGRFCIENSVWCRVPGKLYPYPRGTAPEYRARSYLIIAPETP